MKSSYITLAAVVGLPIIVFAAILLAPSIPVQEQEDGFVHVTDAEKLMIQTHELPKYRPPLNWDRVLKSPYGVEGPEFVDGAMAVYSRKDVDDAATGNIVIVEQASHRVAVFDTSEAAKTLYTERVAELRTSESDVTFNTLGANSTCEGFYNRTAEFDNMVTPCRYGNVYYEVRTFSRPFESKNRTLAVIAVTERKMANFTS